VSHDDAIGKHIRVMSAIPDQVQSDSFSAPIPIAPGSPIELRVDVDEERLLFAYRIGAACLAGARQREGGWQWLPQVFDASVLSDEATAPGQPNFTGAFVGIACHDTSGAARHADFDWFEYRERAFTPWPPASNSA
jgi:xylan 1,4-beta-xylosidase